MYGSAANAGSQFDYVHGMDENNFQLVRLFWSRLVFERLVTLFAFRLIPGRLVEAGSTQSSTQLSRTSAAVQEAAAERSRET